MFQVMNRCIDCRDSEGAFNAWLYTILAFSYPSAAAVIDEHSPKLLGSSTQTAAAANHCHP